MALESYYNQFLKKSILYENFTITFDFLFNFNNKPALSSGSWIRRIRSAAASSAGQFQYALRSSASITSGSIAATRKTGGSRWGCKPPLLGQRLKALAFTLYGEKFAPAPFSPPRSSHTALHSSLPLKGLCTTCPDP